MVLAICLSSNLALLLPLVLVTHYGVLLGVEGGNAKEAATLLLVLQRWSYSPSDFSSWKSNSSNAPCTWRGITCNKKSSHVSEIQLRRLLKGGTLGSQLSQLSYLKILDLSGNNLNGLIPWEIATLRELSILDLSFNSIQGFIPPQLGSLPSLKRLVLRHNQLIGPIPSALANATSLKYLMLENNNLTGLFPAEIPESLLRLVYLSLGNNNISGHLPANFSGSNTLVALYLERNQFTGSLPESFGSFPRLHQLHIYENALMGEIPASLGLLGQLRELRLFSNKLSGEIPEQLGDLSNLTVLDLGSNSLSGKIPPSLGNLSSLQTLSLAYNNLSGPIPSLGIFRNISAASYVGNLGLCGPPLTNSSCTLPPSPSLPPLPFPHPPQSVRDRLPLPPPSPATSDSTQVRIIVGSMFGVIGLAFVALCVYFMYPTRPRRRLIGAPADPIPSAGKTLSFVRDDADNFDYDYKQIMLYAGNYDRAHIIGKGRLATVYLSELPDGNRLAVKLFQCMRFDDRFDTEIAALGRIEHPHVLRVRGFHSNPEAKAIFTDYMPNGSLHDTLRQRKASLDWSMRLRIATMAAQGLEHLHLAHRLVHKDVKSTNILLDADMAPRLADFGLAGLMAPREVIKVAIGSPGYTSPEVDSGRSKFTTKSDIYAFGVVLLELITGRKPVSHLGDQRTVTLVVWAKRLHSENRDHELLDTSLLQTCPSLDHLNKFLELALLCVNDHGIARPTMSKIVSILQTFSTSHPIMPSMSPNTCTTP